MAQIEQGATLHLKWRSCGSDNHWCSLDDLDLTCNSLTKGGVYIIWMENCSGQARRTIYVGQGKPIAKRLSRHCKKKVIRCYQNSTYVLKVTWATARKNDRGGIENFLANKLNPYEGKRWSQDNPIKVNLPW